VKLDGIAASVLYLLWKRRRNKDGSLVAAKTLHEELRQGLATAEFRNDLKVTAVKKTLRKLVAEGMVEYGESQKSNPIPGPAPNGYRLSADAPIITWRATAAIVMLLHNHEQRRLKRETIIRAAVELGLAHHHRKDSLSSQEISEVIDWCLRQKYFREEEVTIDEMPHPKVEKRLITTSKVDDHELFLKKIAAESRIEQRGESGREPHKEIDLAG
jgi:hypothetical protein